MFASSSSFMLLVVRRLHQNVRVIRISQLISRKCAEWVLHSALPQLLNAFSFPLQYNFSDCLVIDIVPLSLMTFWRSLRLYHHRNRLCRGMEKYNFFSSTLKRLKSTRRLTLTFWRRPCCRNAAVCIQTNWQWLISSSCKTALHHTAPKQLKISFETTCPISLAHKNGHRIRQIWIR